MLDRALLVMREAHKGQTRWDGKTPYEVHPIKVVEILRDMGVRDENMLSAGYLHDVLEDTDYSPKKIKDEFGADVLSLIKELTNPFEKMSDQQYYDHVSKMSSRAQIIKMADMIANCEDKSKDGHFYVKRFNAMKIILKDLLRYVE